MVNPALSVLTSSIGQAEFEVVNVADYSNVVPASLACASGASDGSVRTVEAEPQTVSTLSPEITSGGFSSPPDGVTVIL